MIDEIKEKLTNTFNFRDMDFDEEKHIYTVNGKKISRSVSQIVHEYSAEKKFDADFWAKKKAKERGITKEEILKEWAEKGNKAAVKGTKVHKFMENLYKGIVDEDLDILNDKEICLKFYEETKNIIIPVLSELRVYDVELDIAGTIDQLFYHPKKNQLWMLDWKTNKNIGTFSEYKNKMKKPFENYDACELYNYSLQLSIYKYIIEKRTDLKIDSMKLVWINSEYNDTYKIFDCLDFNNEVKQILG